MTRAQLEFWLALSGLLALLSALVLYGAVRMLDGDRVRDRDAEEALVWVFSFGLLGIVVGTFLGMVAIGTVL